MAKENKAKKKDEWGEQNAPFSVIVLHLLVLPVWQIVERTVDGVTNNIHNLERHFMKVETWIDIEMT